MKQKLFTPSVDNGLHETDIEPLRQRYGKNVFTKKHDWLFLQTIWGIVAEPMFLLLVAACAVYFLLGKYQEGALMLCAMVFVGAIAFYQEIKSSKALGALKQLTDPRVKVIRDAKEQTIIAEDLLPGDWMILEEGNRVPADALIRKCNDLSVNESIITGESFPIDKFPENILYQGTIINSGTCYAEVTWIGNNTYLGKLGKSLESIISPPTRLQRQINHFVRLMALIGAVAFALIWLVNYLHSGDWLASLLFGLTLAMSAVPEEIPVAFSSFMALGAAKMSKLGIITRQPQTIENLGAVTVICLDKTGTITENKMKVKEIYDLKEDKQEEIDGKDIKGTDIINYARLASEEQPYDAMEQAIDELYQSLKVKISLTPIIHEYPLSGKPPMMTHVYRHDDTYIVAAKGAPEKIIDVCHLDLASKCFVNNISNGMAEKGYRILGVCRAELQNKDFPKEQEDFNWNFLGLVALYDPPKKNISNVFKQWQQAGIKIKLITGDFPETVINIGKQVGLLYSGRFLTGEQVMQLSEQKLSEEINRVNIYARMFPEAKFKVIEALKKNGEVVGMTGDGVNDGPALKSADIGIAMGKKGTEIARDAADLIITDDDLEKITDAIRHGRNIYNNIQKAIRYIISIHIPIVLTASLPLFLGWKFPNIFSPVHIIFLELVMGPTCSIFYEREQPEANIMLKPPRPVRQNIFSRQQLLVSIVQGLMISIAILSFYYYLMHRSYTIEYVRTAVFITLMYSNIFLTFVNRSFETSFIKVMHRKNGLVPYVTAISAMFLLAIQFIVPLQHLFQITNLSLPHYAIGVALALISTAWMEIFKS